MSEWGREAGARRRERQSERAGRKRRGERDKETLGRLTQQQQINSLMQVHVCVCGMSGHGEDEVPSSRESSERVCAPA